MKEGLLWYDNNPNHKLADKIKWAAERYQARLQRKPTVCYLNSADFDQDIVEINGITLKPATNIRPHYLWLGVESEPASTPAQARAA